MRIAITLLTILLLSAPAFANNATNIEINVDITSDNAAKAQNIAMSQANRKAIEEVAINFTTSQGVSEILSLTDKQLYNFIKETTVLEEKSSNIRYIAKLNIAINADMIKEYLQDKKITVIVPTKQKVVIIPILHNNEQAMLWQADNIWLNAWNNNSTSLGAIEVKPLNDNYSTILSVQKILTYDVNLFQQIANLEEVNNIYILEAKFDELNNLSIKMTNALTLEAQDFSIATNSTNIQEQQDEIDATQEQKNEQALMQEQETSINKAVETLSYAISDKLKSQSETYGQTINISVLYDFSGVDNWNQTKSKIASIPNVKNVSIQALSSSKIQFNIKFAGNIESLTKRLQTKDFALYKNPNQNSYILSKN